MNPKYEIIINHKEPVELAQFTKGYLLPEIITSLELKFDSGSEDININIMSLMVVLDTLLDRIKNKSEYTIIMESLSGCLLALKKLEFDAQLGDDRY